MTKEDIKYIEDYLEWVRQNINPAEVDFEHFANGMMNCNNILSQALSLHNVVKQSELLVCDNCKYTAIYEGYEISYLECMKCGKTKAY